MARLPTYFLSHGGGPWPWMKDRTGGAFDRLEASLADIPRQFPSRPNAVLVVTGHWEAPRFTVSSGSQPGMIYDYSGFPAETYRISYPAPGSPDVAARVQELLKAGGVAADSDAARGFDHGTFSLMKPIYPDADVPVVQLALQEDLDPEQHLAAGRLLAPLRDEGVLILGSGSSYHNLRQWNASGALASRQFDSWLQETMQATPDARAARLAQWERAPAARIAHPREEHLLPLMVALGAAENEPATLTYHQPDFMGAIAMSSFRFG
jgi:aromatic ring-opening dioxygenase catalytic subunit (LigB family)